MLIVWFVYIVKKHHITITFQLPFCMLASQCECVSYDLHYVISTIDKLGLEWNVIVILFESSSTIDIRIRFRGLSFSHFAHFTFWIPFWEHTRIIHNMLRRAEDPKYGAWIHAEMPKCLILISVGLSRNKLRLASATRRDDDADIGDDDAVRRTRGELNF